MTSSPTTSHAPAYYAFSPTIGNESVFSPFLSQHLPTIVFLALLAIIVAVFLRFISVFTVDLNTTNPPDEETKDKVRKMVVFCYRFMMLTLAVAISPLIFLMTFPQGIVSQFYNYMLDSPFALVVGCVHDNKPEDQHWEIVCKPEDTYVDEWLITIGGLVLPIGEGSPESDMSIAPVTPTETRSLLPVSKTPPIKQFNQKHRVARSHASMADGATQANPAGALAGFYYPPPWSPDSKLALKNYWNFPNTVIHGGITVPLYFIIVALVGASISLTRKIPEYQRRFLDVEHPLTASEMREHLVAQILQFLSAPSLAIAGYVLLTPAGPTTSIPLAFLAGFSSETILKLVTSAIPDFGSKRATEGAAEQKPPPV